MSVLLILEPEIMDEFLKQGIFDVHSNTRQKTLFIDGDLFTPTSRKTASLDFINTATSSPQADGDSVVFNDK